MSVSLSAGGNVKNKLRQGGFLKKNYGLLFVSPALFFYTIFVIIPIITTVWYSLHKWNGASPTMEFVGLKNYIALFTDEIFLKALINNLIWIFASLTIPISIGLFLAILISQVEVKGKTMFRVIYFLPAILSSTIVSYIWDWMYNPSFGVINAIIKAFGSNAEIAWLGDENLVLLSLIIVSSWTSFGFNMVVFIAAIQNISPDYYDVAMVEGLNRFQIARFVTIPLIRNSLILMLVNTLIGSMKVFDIVFLLTKGGPYNSSEVIATYMYKHTFELFNVGYGSAIAVALGLIILCVSMVSMKIGKGGEQ